MEKFFQLVAEAVKATQDSLASAGLELPAEDASTVASILAVAADVSATTARKAQPQSRC